MTGKIEREIFNLREEHPLVIPQFDPEKWRIEEVEKAMKILKEETDIQVISVGSSVANARKMQQIIDIISKDNGLISISYITNSAIPSIQGIKGKSAVYWSFFPNSQNPYFEKDLLINSSRAIKENDFEAIPTAYVFDDRETLSTSTWILRAFPVPRNKPEITISIGLAMQFLGIKFYIMAGGSGAKLPPPVQHIKALRQNTNLFIIPTSGIKTELDAEDMFKHGGDAIHVGHLIEEKGIKSIIPLWKTSKNYEGRSF